LRRGWTKSWRLTSVLSLTWLAWAACFAIPTPAVLRVASKAPSRANELALAGLHPGKDRLIQAKNLYGNMRRVSSGDTGDDKNILTWEDPCRQETLRVEGDNSGVIQFLTVQAKEHSGKCAATSSGKGSIAALGARWRTAHGLGIGDDRSRVIEIYGEPGSDGPSTGEHIEGELMYYAFDWAGSDVPQVMEVYCDRATNRVIEITLSNPSL
jgi:hypothetical protein